MTLFLDGVLEEVTNVLDQGLGWDHINSRIKDIIEAKASENHSVFHRINQENTMKFSLLLGFCYQYGIGVVKDEKQALKVGKKMIRHMGTTCSENVIIKGGGLTSIIQKHIFITSFPPKNKI